LLFIFYPTGDYLLTFKRSIIMMNKNVYALCCVLVMSCGVVYPMEAPENASGVNGAEVSDNPSLKPEDIFEAVEQGNLDVLKAYANQGGSLDIIKVEVNTNKRVAARFRFTLRERYTLAHLAARSGQLEILRWLGERDGTVLSVRVVREMANVDIQQRRLKALEANDQERGAEWGRVAAGITSGNFVIFQPFVNNFQHVVNNDHFSHLWPALPVELARKADHPAIVQWIEERLQEEVEALEDDTPGESTSTKEHEEQVRIQESSICTPCRLITATAATAVLLAVLVMQLSYAG